MNEKKLQQQYESYLLSRGEASGAGVEALERGDEESARGAAMATACLSISYELGSAEVSR